MAAFGSTAPSGRGGPSRVGARPAPGRPATGLRRAGPAALAALLLAAAAGIAQERAGEAASTAGDTVRTSGATTTYRVEPATSEIRVDGVLGEPAWGDAARVELRYEWFPGDNVPAPVQTECFVTYDASRLYLACRAHDPDPSRIQAHLADRDTPFWDDLVILTLDTFNDQRRAFQFRVNPLGVQMDALLSQGSQDFSWDAIWNSAGRITEDGYTVEAAIPFKSLSFQPAGGEQTRGFIVERSWPRSVQHWTSNIRVNRNDPCLLCQAERLVGFAGVEPGRDVELNPTLTMSRTDRREELRSPRLVSGEVKLDPGLNVRWRVTPNVALDATVNPDFSQVEADVAQLEVNRRFALFFPEKRPFFLEGADLLRVPGNLIFTRTVVDPAAGVKVTGKVGRNAIGLFVARDQANALIFPGPERSSPAFLEQGVTTGVLRYRRDLGESSTLGFFFTGREAAGYHNRLWGADGVVRVARRNTFAFVAARAETRYPDSLAAAAGQPTGSFDGNGFAVSFEHRGRSLVLFAGYDHVEPRARADAGFLPQVGMRGPSGGASYTFWGSGDGWFSVIRAGGEARWREDFDGRLLERSVALSADYEGLAQTEAGLELELRRQTFQGETFDLVRTGVDLGARPSGDVSLGLEVGFGDAVDFENVREGRVLELSPSARLRPGAHLDLKVSHTLERLGAAGRRIFLANLAQGRILYHFGRRAFVRAIVQYERVHRNPHLYRLPVERESEGLFGQFLFSYKMNPRTVLFLGYSENRAGLTQMPLTRTDRSFFLKLGYAWRP